MGKSDQGVFIIKIDIYVTRYGQIFMGSVHRNGHVGPDGEQRCSSTLSLTSAVDVGGWPTPRRGCFTPGKENQYPLLRRMGGPQGLVWEGATEVQPPYRPARSWSLYRHVQGYFGFLDWKYLGNLRQKSLEM